MKVAVLKKGIFTQEQLESRFADLIDKILFWTEIELNLPMSETTTIMTKVGGLDTVPTENFRIGILMNIETLREELEEIRPFLWHWSMEEDDDVIE